MSQIRGYDQESEEFDEEDLTTKLRLNRVRRDVENALHRALKQPGILDDIDLNRPIKPPDIFPEQPRLSAPATKDVEGILSDIDKTVRSLGHVFGREQHEPSAGEPAALPIQGWTLGSVRLRFDQRPILRGYAQLCRETPIAPSLTSHIVAYFITIPGLQDLIVRENHGHWGYHYHYCNSEKQRSDTILCFDIAHQHSQKPLFYEDHAEGKAKFQARPATWKDRKRWSIYKACSPDLTRWPNGPFKRPTRNAGAVWPIT